MMKCTSQAPTRQRLEGVRQSAHCVEAGGEEGPADKCAYVGWISVGGGLGLYPNFEGR